MSRVESKMVQLADAFAKPMMCLLADLNQWFRQSGLDFVPEAVYNDVNVSHRNSLVLARTRTFGRALPIFRVYKQKCIFNKCTIKV